ncbi:MAG: hypothetical protein ACPIOQ_26940, partial [Promethearchaeia archaeon]
MDRGSGNFSPATHAGRNSGRSRLTAMVPGSALVLLVAVACIRTSGAGVEEPFLCQSVARLEGDGVPRSHALACEGGLHGSFTSLRDWLD